MVFPLSFSKDVKSLLRSWEALIVKMLGSCLLHSFRVTCDSYFSELSYFKATRKIMSKSFCIYSLILWEKTNSLFFACLKSKIFLFCLAIFPSLVLGPGINFLWYTVSTRSWSPGVIYVKHLLCHLSLILAQFCIFFSCSNVLILKKHSTCLFFFNQGWIESFICAISRNTQWPIRRLKLKIVTWTVRIKEFHPFSNLFESFTNQNIIRIDFVQLDLCSKRHEIYKFEVVYLSSSWQQIYLSIYS